MSTKPNKSDYIETPHLIDLIIGQCETRCVAECCGLNAFRFSPLNIAFFFTVNELKPDCVSKEDVRRVKRDLKTLWKNSLDLVEDENGDIGTLRAVARPISRHELRQICKEIEHNIDVARELVLDMREKSYKKS